jgi:hypothetical protein
VYKVYRRYYFEVVQAVAPTGCFVEEIQELAPIVTLNFVHHQTKSEVANLPNELVPDREKLQVEL